MRRSLLALVLLLTGVALWPSRGPAGLAGRVEGPAGPLAGAVVRYQGSPVGTTSDAAGAFALPALPGARRLTAWKEGFLIGGARATAGASLRLRPLPAEDHDGYEWVDPTPLTADEHRCGNCHPGIWREWASSGHARSATGRHFRNLYDGSGWDGRPGAGWSLLDEHPDGAGVCSSCHAPTVRGDDPALFDLRRVRGVDSRGVHCDFCHKVAGPGEGEFGLTHGRFLLRLLRPRRGQLFFGPLDDVDRGEDGYSPFYRDSRYCAACHEGVVFGVHVYSTYSEWRESPAARAGRHCQDCHMKPTGRMRNVAPGHGGIDRDPATLGNHRFWDTSQLEMLRRCLRLDVRLEGRARVRVRLGAEGVGHRVPTGFIDRQLLVVVEGLDAAGERVALEEGPTLPPAAGPGLAGLPGRLHARLLKDEAGRGPVPFWRAVPEAEDTRLVPGRPEEQVYVFGPSLSGVRVRVLHRRFWAEVARAKGWPDQDLVVIDRFISRSRAGR
jgi:hypothetical protein